jgi:hypothetical protein
MAMTSSSQLLNEVTSAFGRGFFAGIRDNLLGPVSTFAAPASARQPRPRKVAARAPEPPAQRALPVPPPKRSGYEKVHYRQGRGTFEARIIGFDAATKRVELERLIDGKRLWRPTAKVFGGTRP